MARNTTQHNAISPNKHNPTASNPQNPHTTKALQEQEQETPLNLLMAGSFGSLRDLACFSASRLLRWLASCVCLRSVSVFAMVIWDRGGDPKGELCVT